MTPPGHFFRFLVSACDVADLVMQENDSRADGGSLQGAYSEIFMDRLAEFEDRLAAIQAERFEGIAQSSAENIAFLSGNSNVFMSDIGEYMIGMNIGVVRAGLMIFRTDDRLIELYNTHSNRPE